MSQQDQLPSGLESNPAPPIFNSPDENFHRDVFWSGIFLCSVFLEACLFVSTPDFSITMLISLFVTAGFFCYATFCAVKNWQKLNRNENN